MLDRNSLSTNDSIGRVQGEENDNCWREPPDFFFTLLRKDHFTRLRAFSPNPFGTPSLAFTLTVEYLGFPKNAIGLNEISIIHVPM